METLVVECKPTYSPREFSSIILVGAYVPGSVQSAVTTLASQISAIKNSHPNSFVIVLGDFNQTSLNKELPNYKQQVKCPTHEKNNTLDHCYCTIKNAYHAIPRPQLGLSDHFMLYLLPSYKQKLKTAKPRVSKVKCTDNNSLTKLQDCLNTTDWDIFKDACPDFNEYTDTVIEYIAFCQNLCLEEKCVKIYNNNKPWFKKTIKACINNKIEKFKNNDKTELKIAKYDLRKAIKSAKRDYANKLEQQFKNNDTRSMWQGLQSITNYQQKIKQVQNNNDFSANELNQFYARFDKQNTSTPPPTDKSTPPPITIDETDVVQVLRKQTFGKPLAQMVYLHQL